MKGIDLMGIKRNNPQKGLSYYMILFLAPLTLFSDVLDIFIVESRLPALFITLYILFMVFVIFLSNVGLKINIGLMSESGLNVIICILFIYVISFFLGQSKDINGIIRIVVILSLHTIYLIFIMKQLERSDVIKIYSLIFKALIIYMVLSNFYDYPGLNLSLSHVMYNRYYGILGTNAHGVMSAFALIIATFMYELRMGKIYLLGALYAFYNLYITGSRASYLVVVLYIVLWIMFSMKISSDIQGILIKMFFLITFAFIVFFIYGVIRELVTTSGSNEIRYALRFSEYSIKGRMAPILLAIDLLVRHKGFPIGIGKTNIDLVRNGVPIDSTYIILFIEIGLIGLLLFILFVGKILIKSARNIRKERFASWQDFKIYKFSFLIALIILAHSFFETMLLNGYKIHSIILFLALSILVKFNYKMR